MKNGLMATKKIGSALTDEEQYAGQTLINATATARRKASTASA